MVFLECESNCLLSQKTQYHLSTYLFTYLYKIVYIRTKPAEI